MTSNEHTETLNAPHLQIWTNAAFDDGDSNLSSAIEPSWSNNLNESFDSDCSKDNQKISLSVSSSSLKSSVSFSTDDNPIRSGKVKEKPHRTAKAKHGDIDAEIEEIEKEMNRLSIRLESLRLEKADQIARSVAIRGRIVPAKFMESQKQTVKFDTGSKSRTTPRRGVSLGPGEIYSAAKKTETVSLTPLQSAQNRRKSCFFKLPGIEEGRAARGRSLSPRSRKAKMTSAAAQKQAAATTGGAKRGVKKEESVLSMIQPKKLFKEEEKRKPLKPGRVVASRYSLANKTDARKRSLPENEEKENHPRSEKRRASDENRKGEGGRVKKRWEIPSEVEVYCGNGVMNDETPLGKELPKIRTLRGRGGESPRDSGAAKRVSELESKNSDFTFCQLLKFE